jgi:choline dehydrogenase-like flavoprotein
VLIVEAGAYVPESTIRTDEILSTAMLYKASGLQRANEPSLFGPRNPSLLVLQGSCLGGGAMVNNAVCFRLPTRTLERWHAEGFPISTADFHVAYSAVAQDLDIVPVSTAAQFLNPASRFLERAFGQAQKPPVADPPPPGFYESLVNLERRVEGDPLKGCESLGLCNLGCGAERKRNALQVYLPRAVATGRCTLLVQTSLVDIRLSSDRTAGRRVVGCVLQTPQGTVEVEADNYVLCAGAIGSSHALLSSSDMRRHIRSLNLPVGQAFCANVGSPLFAFCADVVHQRPSVQIAHYYMPPAGEEGFVLETWYNPPGANAMAMPGYLDHHFGRMQRYASTVSVAPLVRTEADGRIERLGDRMRINMPIGPAVIRRLRRGLITVSEALLNNGTALESVLVGIGGGRELRTQADIDSLDHELRRMERGEGLDLLQVGTGHPQGGNAISEGNAGVVDATFRVRGLSNLRVCDGSIFPQSAGVNPQWTIMALAHCCAEAMRTA